MTDGIIYIDGNPVKAVDNGDGTYSLAVGAGGAGIAPYGVISKPTITISASPDYSVGDVIGGIITLSAIMAATGGRALLRSIAVRDKAGQAPAFTIFFFRATPAAGTYTDNSGVAWGTNDATNNVGAVVVLASDYKTVGGVSFADLGGIDSLLISDTTDLYALIVADATYNAASTSDLIIDFGFERR